jgi:hypothetical protein
MSSSSCPTVAALQELLQANGATSALILDQINSIEQLEAYLEGLGLSLEHCDHLAMAQLIRDFFLQVTDDDLVAAVGGEKFVAKAVVGGVAAGAVAAAVGGGVGAGVEIATH